MRIFKELRLIIWDKIAVQMLFMFIKVNNITLKNKMLLKERASNSSIFGHSKRLYNVTSKFNIGDKGKTI
jgi:hypothetical protein